MQAPDKRLQNVCAWAVCLGAESRMHTAMPNPADALHAGAGRGCRVVCTQPRRLSAVSVAERVAAERGERIGGNIGYTIRLDTKCACIA